MKMNITTLSSGALILLAVIAATQLKPETESLQTDSNGDNVIANAQCAAPAVQPQKTADQLHAIGLPLDTTGNLAAQLESTNSDIQLSALSSIWSQIDSLENPKKLESTIGFLSIFSEDFRIRGLATIISNRLMGITESSKNLEIIASPQHQNNSIPDTEFEYSAPDPQAREMADEVISDAADILEHQIAYNSASGLDIIDSVVADFDGSKINELGLLLHNADEEIRTAAADTLQLFLEKEIGDSITINSYLQNWQPYINQPVPAEYADQSDTPLFAH